VKRREPLTPDMTPLIDVVFILLIFFLVSSTFKKNEKILDLVLPSSKASEELVKKEEISIELSADKLAYNAKVIRFESLDEELEKIKDKTKPINIRIDEDVQYKRVMKLFDLLKKYDLVNLALVTKSQ
jgi:biopolymer transport protein ExbD